VSIATEHFAESPKPRRLTTGIRIVKRKRLVNLALLAVLLLLSFAWIAWQSATQTTASPTIVTGVVLLQGGPPRTSGQHPIKDAALAVTGTTSAGGRVHRYFSAGSRGRFAVKLAPGVYTVTAVISGAATMAGQPHKSITVRSGQPVHLRISLPGL
jgi:hypothetical protein